MNNFIVKQSVFEHGLNQVHKRMLDRKAAFEARQCDMLFHSAIASGVVVLLLMWWAA